MKMKAGVNMVKGKATSRGSNQQVVSELKQRVILALNKLADRDTYQIAVEELQRTIQCLNPDGVVPFLSCILDTDSEQKSAVRKECVRLMGTLVISHEGIVRPYLGKMVASIVKRLKDSDSVVRDSCIETLGVLASKLSGGKNETDRVFVVLVRPLFEALGERNKQVQSGSALCLSRIIDNIHDPPPLVLQNMLSRTVKLLKDPHFMAKPAVIELNRSIILAGGALTHSSLTAALSSIQDSLKNNDWQTRKAACLALGDIASCGVACLGSFRNSCIRCLESCRFDKVKPVRDVVLQVLQLWRNFPGPHTSEPSEAGSSVKEASYRDDYGSMTSASDSTMLQSDRELANKKVSLSSRKVGRTHIEKSQQSGTDDWHIEIALPKSHNLSAVEIQNDESEGSSVTKSCAKNNADIWSTKSIGYDYVEVGDTHASPSVSDFFTESSNSKVVTVHCDAPDYASLVKSTGTSQRYEADEVIAEEQKYLGKLHDRRSLDSTVTESTSHAMQDCSQTENDLALIRNQLLQIENKQSSMMDMLKALTTTVVDAMSKLQLKVSNLEVVVDKMAQEPVHGERYSEPFTSKFLKSSPGIATPRLSTCTPRSSVDNIRQPPLLSTKHMGVLTDHTFTRNRLIRSKNQNTNMWTDKLSKSFGKGIPTNFCPEIHGNEVQKSENFFNPVSVTKARPSKLEARTSPWKVVKDYLIDGDLESAYDEGMCSGNELLLFDLLDRTGPVLESLSKKTATKLLSILASYLLEQRFVNSIVPWVQQLVELCNIHGPNYLVICSKAKKDFLSAILEAAELDVFNRAERKFFIELGKKLRQIWGQEADLPSVVGIGPTALALFP